MSFKDIFIHKVRLIYDSAVQERNAKETAEELIVAYFKDLKASLEVEILVSKGELSIHYVFGKQLVLTLHHKRLVINLKDNDIEIKSKSIGLDTEETDDSVLDILRISDDYRYKSIYRNEFLDDNLLDSFLRAIFGEELDHLLKPVREIK